MIPIEPNDSFQYNEHARRNVQIEVESVTFVKSSVYMPELLIQLHRT